MALHLSSSSGTVGQTVDQANDFTVHALRRDAEGMLHYTKARSTEDAVFDFHRLDGEQYENFLQGTDYVAAPAGAKTCTQNYTKNCTKICTNWCKKNAPKIELQFSQERLHVFR